MIPTMEDTLRILVVEDEAALVDFFMEALAPLGGRVDWATTAEEAQAAILEKSYTLVTADHCLAGELTGLDLYAFCQENMPALPFLLMSGHSDMVFYSLLRQRGLACPPYLPKPFGMTEFRAILIETFRKYSIRAGEVDIEAIAAE